MNQNIKDELISILHTFFGVLVPILLVSLNSFDFQNVTKASITALVIAVCRSAIKATWNKYMPNMMLASTAHANQ